LDEEVKDELTEKQVWDFLEFANSLSGASGLYPSVFTPQLLNARMRDVSLLSTGGVTESDVSSALENPKENERELLRISESFEVSSTSYKRILQYMANLPAWDITYHCKNIKDSKEYKSPKYQKDLDIVKDFLDKFDYRKEFGTALKQMFREETFFCVLRDEGEKYVLQQLPSDYCMITGRWDYSLLYSFNYLWFQQGGIDINMYPPIFKKTYTKLFTERNEYNPSISIDSRANSMWVMWGDCSPTDGFWAWKLSPEIATRIPYFSGLFPDFAIQNLIRGLQKSSYMASAAKIIMGEVALLNKDQKSTVKDSISISPDILGKFLRLIQTAINNEAVRVASVPLQNVNSIEFKADNDLYSSYLKTTLGSSGVNANLLFSSDIKPNAIETELSASVDEFVGMSVYPYFNSFMDYHINNLTKNYKFGFKFEGSNFYLDRQRRFDTQMALSDKGIVNPQKIAASIGQNPFEFQAQLEEARAMGWVDNLTPLANEKNTPTMVKPEIGETEDNKTGKNGRPKKKESEISESGMQTRSDGANIGRGGKPV